MPLVSHLGRSGQAHASLSYGAISRFHRRPRRPKKSWSAPPTSYAVAVAKKHAEEAAAPALQLRDGRA